MTATPAQVAGGRQPTRWTRDEIISKIQEWHSLYGEPPRSADWNPSAAKWAGQPWRVARYRAGDWPSLNAAKRAFDGSLNAAIRASGFEPAKPGPARRRGAAPVLVEGYGDTPPSVKARLRDMESDMRELRERVETRERMLVRARETATELRGRLAEAKRERVVVDRPAKPETKTKTITKIERVRVQDTATVKRLTRRLERAEEKLGVVEARADMERKAAGEMAKTASRDRKAAEAARASLSDALVDVERVERERDDVADRLAALRNMPAPEPKVVERVVRSATDADVAEARRESRDARAAQHEAEVRAARAERQMREQAAAITGEDRRLTADELAELRTKGPSGPAVLMAAVKTVVEARSKQPAALPAALTKLASAAIRWRDAL